MKQRRTNLNDTVLIGGVEKREVRILDYDGSWPARYEAHAKTIAAALGVELLRLEHIGSTSVPGLGAKPIIDILAVVASSADEGSYVPKLVAAGYELRVREPAFYEHRMLRTPTRDVHIHVYSQGCPEIQRNLAFRDRLRSNHDDRKRYEETKRRLAEQPWPDMNAYADAKTEVIESIIATAIAAGYAGQ